MARILIIDDEKSVLDIIRKVLEMAGYKVEEATDGKQGIELYRNKPADLVITDILMSGKDGFAVIQELKRDYPEAKIIAMAGYGDGLLPKAKELGADRTIDKPFRMQEILEIVMELLGQEDNARGDTPDSD